MNFLVSIVLCMVVFMSMVFGAPQDDMKASPAKPVKPPTNPYAPYKDFNEFHAAMDKMSPEEFEHMTSEFDTQGHHGW